MFSARYMRWVIFYSFLELLCIKLLLIQISPRVDSIVVFHVRLPNREEIMIRRLSVEYHWAHAVTMLPPEGKIRFTVSSREHIWSSISVFWGILLSFLLLSPDIYHRRRTFASKACDKPPNPETIRIRRLGVDENVDIIAANSVSWTYGVSFRNFFSVYEIKSGTIYLSFFTVTPFHGFIMGLRGQTDQLSCCGLVLLTKSFRIVGKLELV